MRRFLAALALVASAFVLPAVARSDVAVGPGGGTPGTSANFTLVGHNDLFGRGMNAAPAMYDHYIYVGNRTDGSSRCGFGDPRREATGLDSCEHPHPGILIVDVDDQDARMRMLAGIETGCLAPRVAETAAARAVGPVPDVDVVVVHRGRRVHPAAEKVVVPDEREVRRGA